MIASDPPLPASHDRQHTTTRRGATSSTAARGAPRPRVVLFGLILARASRVEDGGLSLATAPSGRCCRVALCSRTDARVAGRPRLRPGFVELYLGWRRRVAQVLDLLQSPIPACASRVQQGGLFPAGTQIRPEPSPFFSDGCSLWLKQASSTYRSCVTQASTLPADEDPLPPEEHLPQDGAPADGRTRCATRSRGAPCPDRRRALPLHHPDRSAL